MDKLRVKQLARYMRWQESDDRKPALQSFVSDTVFKPLREWVYSSLAFFRKQTAISAEPCDVLLLHYSRKSQARGYRHALVARLRQRGLTVIETAIDKPKFLLKKRKLLAPGWSFLHRYYYHAAYARWLVTRYQPRVILTDKNGSVLAPFLKDFLEPAGKLVHVAHSIPTDNFRKFSMNAYDYYFLFGSSSLERLQQRTLFGTSQAILTGTYAEKKPIALPATNDTVLILGTGPALEKTKDIQKAYQLLIDTAALLPALHFIVKPHPRSDITPWMKNALPANLRIADPDADLDALLTSAFVATGSFTNAAIDCALQQRPYILISNGSEDVQLDIHRMTPLCNTADALAKTLLAIAQAPDDYRARAVAFADYHLANGFSGPDVIADQVQALVQGNALTNGVVLEGTWQ